MEGGDLRQRNVTVNEEEPKKPNGQINIVRVKRRLGLLSGVAFIVGTVIGSGIFISPKGVLKNAGSVGMCLIVWVICGVLSLCAAMVYSELGILIPKSGGDYPYLLHTFGSLPAFILLWVDIIVLRPGSNVVKALTFAEYLMDAISDGCGPPEYTKKIVALVVLLTITITNMISVRLVARIQILFTFIKCVGLVMIIIGGMVYISKGQYKSLSTGFDGTTENVGDIALAIYSGLWAYGGWNLVLGIFLSLLIVITIYLLVNVSYLALMTKEEFLSSYAVAFTWGEKVIGPAAILIPIIVACSVYGSNNASVYVSGRLLFVAGREGHMPESFSYIHIRNQIPMFSLIINVSLSCILLIPANIGALLNFIGFLGWFFYGLGMINVIILRFKMKDAPRVFKVPLVIPVVVLLCAIYLVVAPFIQNPRVEFLYALGFTVSGVIVWIPFVYFKLKLPGMDYLTYFVQCLLEIEPTTEEDDILERLRSEGNQTDSKK